MRQRRATRIALVVAITYLVLLVGPKKAKEYVFSGREVDALEAERVGLITRAVPSADLDAETQRYARAVALPPTDGMVFAKESLNAQMEARGLGGAWRFTADLGLVAAPTRAGRTASDRFDFFDLLHREGPDAAVAARDRLLADLGI